MALFANMDIEARTELTFDYGQEFKQAIPNAATRTCLCGSEVCRGILPSHEL